MTSAAEEAGVTTTPLKGIRRTAARRMVSAWEAPVFHLSVEVDMTAALGVKTQVPGATVTDVLLSTPTWTACANCSSITKPRCSRTPAQPADNAAPNSSALNFPTNLVIRSTPGGEARLARCADALNMQGEGGGASHDAR